jgi:hypothetical protein
VRNVPTVQKRLLYLDKTHLDCYFVPIETEPAAQLIVSVVVLRTGRSEDV